MAVGFSGVRASQTAADNTNHTALLPNGSNVSGRRIIVIAAFDGNPTVTWPSGWTSIVTGVTTTSDGRLEVRYHDFNGTEGWDGTDDPVALTTSVAEEAAFITYAVTGYDPAIAPEGATATTGGLTVNPDPPNLTPSWGSAENLWIAVSALETGSDFTVAPTDYTTLTFLNTAGSGGTGLGTATRLLTATSENPGPFTITNTRRNVNTTLAVKPESAAEFTLTVADSTHAQTADGVDLTQVHQLVVEDSTHAQTADQTTLTQDHQLIVDDATHAQTADGLTLEQTHNLEVADSTHSQEAESPSLTQDHTLGVHDATHQLTSDNVVVTTDGLTLMGRIYAGASLLLDCVCEALGDRCPSRTCVAPGVAVSIENCCAGDTGGQLNINVARMYPSRDFPTPVIGIRNCDAPYTVVEYLITLARCVPVGNMQRPPTCVKLDESAQSLMDDLEDIFTGVSCCLKTSPYLEDLAGRRFPWIIGDVESIGPEGGCAGAVVSVLVGYDSCLGC